MPLQPISSTALNQLHPDRSTSMWIYEDVEWFADRSRVFIGYIARNGQTGDWLFVVEGRDERGQFHAIESRDKIASRQEAHKLLEASVNELLATGVKVFHRGSYTLK